MTDPKPLQFRIRTLLGMTVAVALLFAMLRWLGVPPQTSAIVLVLLTVSVAAAVGLVIVIARSSPGPRDDP